MNTIALSMTAQQPSFGMPTFGTAQVMSAAFHGADCVARVRPVGGHARAAVAATSAIKAAKPAFVTGAWDPSAWRPPIC